MAYMRDSARPFPLMCIHAAVAAFAAFSFHVMTASAKPALGHNTRSDRHTPMLLAFCFISFILPPLIKEPMGRCALANHCFFRIALWVVLGLASPARTLYI